MNNLQNILEGIGFEDKEALVYLACLELDGTSNSHIAKKAGLNRITNYEILKRLINQGVVTSFKKRHAKNFVAIDPRILIKQAKDKVVLAEQSLSELLSISNKLVKKPKIYFFEGIEGIKTIYDDSLNAQTEILTFTNPADLDAVLGKFINSYVQERVRRKIKVRGVAPNDQSGINAKNLGSTVLREVRIFSKEKYEIQNEIMIYNNKIAIYSGQDKMGLIIENPTLAKTVRSIWKMAWDYCSKSDFEQSYKL